MKPNHSGAIRIIANYGRLVTTCVFGLIIIRILLTYGDNAFGLIALLGTGSGLALMLKEVVRTSTVPVLGKAFHSEKENWFEAVVNSALLCSFVAGIVTLLVFGVFAICFQQRFLKFPEELYTAAIVFVCAAGIQSFVVVFLSPLINFYAVSERMVPYNLFLTIERLGDFAAAVVTAIVVTKTDASTAVMTYGICVASNCIAVNLLFVYLIIREEPRLTPNVSAINRVAISEFSKSAGWNSVVILALNLHARVDMVIMNVFFGLFGTAVFGIANQSANYIRLLIMGVVSGVDSVASRIANKNGDDAVVRMIHRTTKLQAIIVFPGVVVMFVFCEPLIRLWIAGRLEDPETSIPAICLLIRILIFGVAARCLSEGWMWIMNGAGKVKSYAPVILVGGILNPILAVSIIKFGPTSSGFYVPAIVFSSLLVLVHLIGIPAVVSREYKISFFNVIQPLIRPAFVTFVCFIFSWAGASVATNLQRPYLLTTLFCISYSTAGYFLLLDRSDRTRLAKMVEGLPVFSNLFSSDRTS